jgi:hypothetical protein
MWEQFKALDFGGIFLFCAGMVLFLIGLSLGGTVYPWTDAHVLGTLIVGIFTIIGFVLYGMPPCASGKIPCSRTNITRRGICRQRSGSHAATTVQEYWIRRHHYCVSLLYAAPVPSVTF